MHGVEAIEQQHNERIQHLQSRGLRRCHFGFLQTHVEQLRKKMDTRDKHFTDTSASDSLFQIHTHTSITIH